MLSKELEKIAGHEIQTYLFSEGEGNTSNLQLRDREMFGLPFKLLAGQLNARKKIAAKLPSFYRTKGILYPPSINLEQSSSEPAGNFKAETIVDAIGKTGAVIADLTGGFGVDSFFFSKRAAAVDYIEPDSGLLDIARHNLNLLGCSNIQYHETTAIDFLNSCQQNYDLIYLDPSRRDAHTGKVFRLADCQPDIAGIFHQLFEFTGFVLIKTSPLLDIQQGLKELNTVKKVLVVSVNNECKELLFLMQKGFSGEPIIETYNLDKLGKVKQFFHFTWEEEKNTNSDFSEPQTYLYEPNASILKAGAFKSIGKKFGLQKLQANTHFYTSNLLNESFPGRIFKIDQLEFDRKNFLEKKANVITRNYPLSAEELKKKLKLADGGEKYVIGFSSTKKKYSVLATRLA
jgi:hypothetical protein